MSTPETSGRLCFYCCSVFIGFSTRFLSLIKCIHLEYWCVSAGYNVFDATEETLVLLHPYKVSQISEKFSPEPLFVSKNNF